MTRKGVTQKPLSKAAPSKGAIPTRNNQGRPAGRQPSQQSRVAGSNQPK